MIRAINKNCNRFEAVLPLYYKLNLLQLHDVYKLELSKFMFLFQHSLLPLNFTHYFDKVKSVHSYGTRMASNFKLYIPRYNTATGQKTLMFSGAKTWNDLPINITQCNTVRVFQKLLKNFFLKNYQKENSI